MLILQKLRRQSCTLLAQFSVGNRTTVILGGAGSDNHVAWASEWNRIAAEGDQHAAPNLRLVKAALNGDVLDWLPVSVVTVEKLFGKDLAALIDSGQHVTAPDLTDLLGEFA